MAFLISFSLLICLSLLFKVSPLLCSFLILSLNNTNLCSILFYNASSSLSMSWNLTISNPRQCAVNVHFLFEIYQSVIVIEPTTWNKLNLILLLILANCFYFHISRYILDIHIRLYFRFTGFWCSQWFPHYFGFIEINFQSHLSKLIISCFNITSKCFDLLSLKQFHSQILSSLNMNYRFQFLLYPKPTP